MESTPKTDELQKNGIFWINFWFSKSATQVLPLVGGHVHQLIEKMKNIVKRNILSFGVDT